ACPARTPAKLQHYGQLSGDRFDHSPNRTVAAHALDDSTSPNDCHNRARDDCREHTCPLNHHHAAGTPNTPLDYLLAHKLHRIQHRCSSPSSSPIVVKLLAESHHRPGLAWDYPAPCWVWGEGMRGAIKWGGYGRGYSKGYG